MLNNIDLAGKYLKTIVDCNRCSLCDKSDGDRMRFVCGHSACADCVAVSGDCPTCSPSMDSSSKRPQLDVPHTERVKHATELFTSFQDTFNVDVYKRLRISEQLKVEKELFPECIQAPSKYFNRRKSLNVSQRNKENKFQAFFPGQEISSSREAAMNKSKNYVQEWLNKNTSTSALSRSPLSDLKVNTHHMQATSHSRKVKGNQKQNAINLQPPQSNRKRSRLKQTLSISSPQPCLENYLKPVEKGQCKNTWSSAKRLKQELEDGPKEAAQQVVLGKKHCDESGIVIDDDCFTIEDSQDVTDKDRLALLAVAKADSQASTIVNIIKDSQVRHDNNFEKASTFVSYDDQMNIYNRVPFYKKSYLFENCNQCLDGFVNVIKPELHDNCSRKSSDFSITVENKSFVTTIKVVDCKQSYFDKKQSTAVQTDIEEPFYGFEQPTQKEETITLISNIENYIQSEYKFIEDNITEKDSQKTTCTDTITKNTENNLAVANLVLGDIMEVDHKRKYGYGVLTEHEGSAFQNRRRKGPRGVTPDSNNSSDKENCDPNRMKKNNAKKKKKANK